MSTTKQDNRPINDGTSGLPKTISLSISQAGTKLGAIAVPQTDRLSEKGNVSFNGGIRKGWTLKGVDVDTDPGILAGLESLTFEVDGTPLVKAASGVHLSDKGNPTVCHTARIEMSNGTENKPYQVQVYATFSRSKGAFSLSVRGFAASAGGPVIVGQITGKGLLIDA